MSDLIIPKIWEGKEICICVTDEQAVFVYDEEQGKFIDTGETAIELPPHGRLIEGDGLADVLVQNLEPMLVARGVSGLQADVIREVVDAIVTMLRECPTVLEANNE